MEHTCAVILAAGKGTRMKSKKPKVLAQLLFKPMLGYVLDACHEAEVEKLCVVTGYRSDSVCEYVTDYCKDEVCTVLQQEQKGTGHAVMMAKEFLEANRGGDVCIMCGDTPFLSGEVIREAYVQHKTQKNAVTIVTAQLENPFGYGRIVRDNDRIVRIVEQKDANDAESAIREINSGVYWFEIDNLLEQLDRLQPNNAQGEYYLTDTIDLTIQSDKKVGGYRTKDSNVILGANSREDLYYLTELLRKKVIRRLMEEGVSFVSTDGVLICPDAEIGCDTTILGGTVIKEGVRIGEDCIIGPNTLIRKSEIGDRVTLNSVQCYQSKVHSDTDIGPFVHIRPNSEIKSHVHIGDFVEVKNSTIGEGTGISHLTYVGDSDVGKNVNFGCGVVTVNYDGVHKHRCVIEDEAFIGCNTNLIAPVHIGKSAYTAAGSTITKDVEDYALAIARSRQEIKEGYAAKKLAGRKKKV